MKSTAIFRQLTAIERILFVGGVDVRKKHKKSNFLWILSSVYNKFAVLWWMAFTLRTIATMLSIAKGNIALTQLKLTRKLLETTFFVLWFIMIKARQKITVLIRDLENIASSLDRKIIRSWIRYATVVIITVPLLGTIALNLSSEEEYCQAMLRYQSGNLITVSRGHNCLVWYILAPFCIMPPYILHTGVCITYIIFCYCFRNILNIHSKSGLEKKYINFKDYRYHLLTYDRIIKVLQDFEKVMSYPIFVAEINDFTGILFGLIALDPFKRLPHLSWSPTWIWVNVFVSLRALISFLCVCLTASSVTEASKNARNIQKEIMKRVTVPTIQEKSELLVFIKAHKTQPFKLSAGGFFYLNKSLVLTAVGSALTYSLLILQLT
ncbi:hypothetical protein AVEN_270462-1 [Araneus ventricosus]|uniref:Gustatory receptor n=1 Tax=Araneus ventricosus TaxID=182803 RepID=A0A4Y2B6W7_ARAVE|nr:hypothetical protein AVEN_270462-1 [Araneus ventricosus]